MELKAGYKVTDVGVIPEDWEIAALGNLIQGSPRYGINAPAVSYSDKLPAYLRITDISPEGRYLQLGKVSVNSQQSVNYFLSDGDIVFARTGASVGKSYQYTEKDGPLVFAGFLIRVRPDKDKICPAYLYAICNSSKYWSWVRLMSMRSGQPGINGKEYSELPIPLPPLSEQYAIAEALNTVDELIASIDQLIAKKHDLKQAAMQQLLTGQTRLQGFSGEWETKRFSELFYFNGGYSASRADLSSSGVLYLHYGDIHGSKSSLIDVDIDAPNIPKLDVSMQKVPSQMLLKDGDVVFVDASEDSDGVSKHVVIQNKSGTPFIAGLHTVVARSKSNDLSIDFKQHCFKTKHVRDQFLFYAAGTKVLGVNKSSIAKLILSFPALREQTAIAEILSDMDKELTELEQRRDKTVALKQGMMQELLTGRTRLV